MSMRSQRWSRAALKLARIALDMLSVDRPQNDSLQQLAMCKTCLRDYSRRYLRRHRPTSLHEQALQVAVTVSAQP